MSDNPNDPNPSGPSWDSGATGPGSAPPPPPGSYGSAPPPPGDWSGGPGGAGGMTQSDERLWSMLGHLGSILLGFIAPLIVLLVYGQKSPFVRRHAVESLNFQITLLIAYVVSFILIFVLIGILMIFVVWIGSLVLMVMAGLAANRGEDYKYPINWRLVK
jgi:uncharacterized Tic20 family protein